MSHRPPGCGEEMAAGRPAGKPQAIQEYTYFYAIMIFLLFAVSLEYNAFVCHIGT